ncbi:MAG: bifunctional alpha,alpha-trehalose-phosphate synthase (UDP-forming)/trehalose-phosphatase [Sphingobacteriales bacterium]|nr:MAG: bifunctional alpha,alpha-trehalose-phosphate synthase (UDP-forming)/trehalose-phosphatase [Sphingobacteriales bacterium]
MLFLQKGCSNRVVIHPQTESMQKRLIIVSNRLPISIEHTADHKYNCRQSSGGLVSAISAYITGSEKTSFAESIWVGVPDCSEKIWDASGAGADAFDYTFLPVFLKWKQYELYYNGFSNSLLWPLFHYFPSFADYNSTYFDAYMAANEAFAEVLSHTIRKDDVVWIHDYHLLPLAGMLRKRFPGITIGFFLHIPFPSFELFRVIPKPWQREILEGMLGADLIGFHTMDYMSHFLSCIRMVLKTEHEGQYISWDNRKVKADAFPIGIDYNLFHNAYDNPEVTAIRDRYLAQKGGNKLIFSVDRLDYTKGISNRLKGYEKFLTDNPDYAGRISFALVIVPSRDSITKYAERKRMIDEYIGDLNSRLGNMTWQPVMYQYGHLSFAELIALYTACDLALITPLRDGMNLVAKEFVASRKDGQGVLVLSEMAGAASELTDALLINPNDTKEIASMIKTGLEMSPAEQEERLAAMQQRVARYNVNAWALDFFEQLAEVKDLQLSFEVKFLDNISKMELLEKFSAASRRLLLLDYDGTLIPFSRLPAQAVPGEELLEIIADLSSSPHNDVYIVSGRNSKALEAWFGHLPVGLVAEHGAMVRHREGAWTTEAVAVGQDWKASIASVMEKYVSRCSRSFIEEKEFSLAWHYRNAELTEGSVRSRELYEELQQLAGPLSLHVLDGNKVIEIRARGINKGTAVDKLGKAAAYDFILSVGDDKTDEDMFAALGRLPQAYTIKVGTEASFARYNLHNPSMVRSLLRNMAVYSHAGSIMAME